MAFVTPHIGPYGFQYSDWAGVVFPKHRARGTHALEDLACFADHVELDLSLQALPKPEIVRLWLNRVEPNPHFLFSAVLPPDFTHDRRLDGGAVAALHQSLLPLQRARRFGALVMTFPWAYRYTSENREFLIQLRRAFHRFPLVAEFRHESWLLEEALGTLIDYRIGLVNIDQPAYFRALPASAVLTSPVGYFRFHGRQEPELFRNDVRGTARRGAWLYTAEMLEEWRGRIERVSAHAARTLAAFCNAAGGRSMVNVLQAQRVWSGECRQAPRELLRVYARELSGFRSSRPVQPFLLPDVAVA